MLLNFQSIEKWDQNGEYLKFYPKSIKKINIFFKFKKKYSS